MEDSGSQLASGTTGAWGNQGQQATGNRQQATGARDHRGHRGKRQGAKGKGQGADVGGTHHSQGPRGELVEADGAAVVGVDLSEGGVGVADLEGRSAVR